MKIEPGIRFGALVVIEKDTPSRSGKSRWICKCDCGEFSSVQDCNLKTGNSKGCGCAKGKTHGLSKTQAYSSWRAMIVRCYNPKFVKFNKYGGAGIIVCEFLRATPRNLIDLIGERPEGKSIDRINGNLSYTCGSCAECLRFGFQLNVRWSDDFQQNQNRNSARLITFNGSTHCIAEWSRILGVSENTLRSRVKRGDDLIPKTITQ